MTTEPTPERGREPVTASNGSAFCLSCRRCEWTARVPEDGDRTDVSDEAAEHFVETGHTPIKKQ